MTDFLEGRGEEKVRGNDIFCVFFFSSYLVFSLFFLGMRGVWGCLNVPDEGLV